ncbi:MAG TPA: HAD family phosphatase [Pirellulales bacterium]|nr:HAD family phosphatase [Pirellulales bacterium]
MPPAFIYFDLGNVLCYFSRPQEIRQVAELSGVPEDKVKDVLIGSHAILWQYERGELNDEQFYSEFCRLTGSGPDMAALLQADSDIFTLNTALLPLVANLEDSQIPLGVLSNISPSHWRLVTDGRYGILPRAFQTFALSYEIGVQKPDEKIYRRATELAGVPAERIFFVDDIEKNVAAARRCGWDAVQYTSPDALEQELRRRGVHCNF